MVAIKTPTFNPATVGYLESIGLNPHRILQDNVSMYGYDELAVDDNGNAFLVNGERTIVRRFWPQDFDWEKFVRCLRIDGIWPGGDLR